MDRLSWIIVVALAGYMLYSKLHESKGEQENDIKTKELKIIPVAI